MAEPVLFFRRLVVATRYLVKFLIGQGILSFNLRFLRIMRLAFELFFH